MDYFLVLIILMAKITLHQAQQHSLNNHHSDFKAFSNDERSGVPITNDYLQVNFYKNTSMFHFIPNSFISN